eukprot:5764552-Amphidinium_carterae.1
MHAYLKGRCREGAMLAQRALGWTLRAQHIPFYSDLRDMRNAFACTKAELRESCLMRLIAPQDQ